MNARRQDIAVPRIEDIVAIDMPEVEWVVVIEKEVSITLNTYRRRACFSMNDPRLFIVDSHEGDSIASQRQERVSWSRYR